MCDMRSALQPRIMVSPAPDKANPTEGFVTHAVWQSHKGRNISAKSKIGPWGEWFMVNARNLLGMGCWHSYLDPGGGWLTACCFKIVLSTYFSIFTWKVKNCFDIVLYCVHVLVALAWTRDPGFALRWSCEAKRAWLKRLRGSHVETSRAGMMWYLAAKVKTWTLGNWGNFGKLKRKEMHSLPIGKETEWVKKLSDASYFLLRWESRIFNAFSDWVRSKHSNQPGQVLHQEPLCLSLPKQLQPLGAGRRPDDKGESTHWLMVPHHLPSKRNDMEPVGVAEIHHFFAEWSMFNIFCMSVASANMNFYHMWLLAGKYFKYTYIQSLELVHFYCMRLYAISYKKSKYNLS